MLFLASSLVAPADPPTLEARRKNLDQFLADEWEYELLESPELATLLGDLNQPNVRRAA
ncbi:MAG: hypothetical protein WA628_00225 [Terriglobales bacterium]